jgi:hypothetical protein
MNYDSGKKATVESTVAISWKKGANYAWNNIDCVFDPRARGRATAMVA